MLVNYNFDTYLLDFLTISQLKIYTILSTSTYNIFKNSKYYHETRICINKNLSIENFCIHNCINLLQKYLKECTLIDYSQLLTLAGKYDNIDIIHLLISNNINIDNDNLLNCAYDHNHLDIIKFLYFSGVNIIIDNNNTLLVHTPEKYLNIVKFLLFQTNSISNFSFQIAIMNGYLDVLKFLISQNLNNSYENYEINYASMHGHINIIRFLSFQNLDVQKNNNITFQLASRHGHLEILKYMISHNINKENGNLSLIYAAENNRLEIVKFLISENYTLLDYIIQWVSRYGYLTLVKFLTFHGVDLTLDIDCAIRWASGNGHLDIVRYLFSRVNFIAKNNEPFYYAIMLDHLEVAKFLISQTINCELDYYISKKILKNKNLKIVKFLTFHNCHILQDDNIILSDYP